MTIPDARMTGDGALALSKLMNSVGVSAAQQAESPTMASYVQPVIQLEPHVFTPDVQVQAATVLATGDLTVVTIPQNQSWDLYGMGGVQSTGDFTFDQFRLRNVENAMIVLDTFTATALDHIGDLGKFHTPITLGPLSVLQVRIAVFTTTGLFTFRLYRTIRMNSPE